MNRKVERLGLHEEVKQMQSRNGQPHIVANDPPKSDTVELWEPSVVWKSISVGVKVPIAFESAAGAAAEVSGNNILVRRLTAEALFGLRCLLHGFHNAAERTSDGRPVDIYPNAIIAALEIVGRAAKESSKDCNGSKP